MRNQDYKLKYADLKLKFYDAVDVAFRLGMEQGLQQAQVQQSQQAQAALQAQPGMSGQPGQEPAPGEEKPDGMVTDGTEPDGSELDQHIGTLESMLQKSDPTSDDALTLKKSLEGLKAIQHSFHMAKSNKAISQIAKNMKPPFVLGKRAEKNMPEHAKKALSMQDQIVDDLMKSMAEEEQKASEQIKKTLDFEQLLKG